MMEILVKSWNHQERLKLILDVLMSRRTMKSIEQSFRLSKKEISDSIQQITNNKLVCSEYQILIYKDKDSVYRDHNLNARKLGSKKHTDNLVGLTDKHINDSELAERHMAFDQQVITSQKSLLASDKIFYTDFGLVNAVANICPVVNEEGDSIGVFIISYLDLALKNQSFEFIINSLYRGLAHHFVKNDQYVLKLPNITVTLTRREMECILYVLIGLDTKKIAQHMRLSPRTVDNMISHLKEKLSLLSRQDIAEACLRYHWLDLL